MKKSIYILCVQILVLSFITLGCEKKENVGDKLVSSSQAFSKIPIIDMTKQSQISNDDKNGVKVKVLENKEGIVYGFIVEGTTGYAENGKDIVASGVSTLVQNTVFSIQSFTKDKIEPEVRKGYVKLILPEMKNNIGSREASVLLKSMVLGLHLIENNYGSKYVKVERVIN